MTTAVSTQEPALGLALPLRAAVFVGTLFVFWITLDPLQDLSSGSVLGVSESSDLFKQVVFLSLFAIVVATLLAIGWRRILPLAHPAYAVVLGWFYLGCVFAIYPGISFRRLVLSTIVMVLAGVLPLLPRNQREFESWLGGAALVVVLLCYLAVLLAPELAIHQSDAARETNLVGDWRGLYGHKSVAGPMMVLFVIIGSFLVTRRRAILGPALLVLSGTFLLFTGAKQPQALVPIVFILSWLAMRARSLGWLFALCLGSLGLYLLFTIGSAVFPPIAAFNASLLSDPTFTGRNVIWDFAIQNFLQRPVFGHGFSGFWNTEYVRYTVQAPADSWAANASHSHDSYLDLALTTGLPGLLLAYGALIVLPILDFARARRVPENRPLALLFFRIWLFALFLASLETLFFHRDDPIWFAMLIAIFGLRYLASYRVRP